jgi:asparagine synthetase B (glutamine-hydrolysing)
MKCCATGRVLSSCAVPNLVGIHDATASEEELERDLARMIAAVDLPAFPFTKRTAKGRGIAVGNVLTGVENNLAQPARDEGRGLWLMLDGEILNARDLARSQLRGALGDDPDDSRVALALYLQHGVRFVDHLIGQWNIVVWDVAQKSGLLITDRLGSRMLFCAEDGPRFVFASEAKGVIAGRHTPTRPGGIGLFQLLASGTTYGDRTWLEGVRVVPPGTIVRFEPPLPPRQQRWFKLVFRESGPEMSEDSYVEGFARKLRLATERCMRHRPGHPVAITLSGGLDSRAVALAIDKAHLPITSITYGAAESPDAIYARQLAEVIGLEHHHIEDLWPSLVEQSSTVCDRILGPSPSGKRGFYAAQYDRVCWRSEAMAAMYGLTSMIWHPLYRRFMRIMLNGTSGDAMTGSHLTPNLLFSPTRKQVIDDLRRRQLWQYRDLLERVLAKSFFARGSGELGEYFAGTFKEIDADEPMALANIWDMENRQRRGSFQSFTIERYFCTCRSPFLDDELVDFLRTVPPLYRFQQRVYKRMLVKQFPEASHVPWAYTRGRITASPSYEFLREAFNFTRSRIQRMLPARTPKMAHWIFRDEVRMLREDRDLAIAIDAWTRAPYFPSEVFDGAGVREFTAAFVEGSDPRQTEMSTLYAHLAGLAKCCEMFFGRDGNLTVPAAADPASFGVDTGP